MRSRDGARRRCLLDAGQGLGNLVRLCAVRSSHSTTPAVTLHRGDFSRGARHRGGILESSLRRLDDLALLVAEREYPGPIWGE